MKIERLFDLLDNYSEKFPEKSDAIVGKENGVWRYYSSSEYIEISNKISCSLLAMGFKKGDRIVTISNNRPEWNFMDMGMLQIGVIHIPIYPTISKEDYYYILNHAMPKMVIVSDKVLFDRIAPLAAMAGIDMIYTFNHIAGATHWSKIFDAAASSTIDYKSIVTHAKENITGNDLCTIIYTSGTTGFPKGVMLSHQNIISNICETIKIHSIDHNCRALSFLPLCHVYERHLNCHYQLLGIGIYYAENMGTIADNLKEIKPHIFCAVPRIFELFYDKIISKGHDLPLLQRLIFFWAVNVGEHFTLNSKNHLYRLKRYIADLLVYSKWRAALGGNLQFVVTGGAAIQLRLLKAFWAANIRIIEGYGLTETSPVISANNPLTGEIKLGTVGSILEGVEVKIAEDGEILTRGRHVMQGYYKEPEQTAMAIDSDGWFHTGDIGMFIEKKYLKITDRKKEIFKLSNGKYIAPQTIENLFKESEFIEQLIVIGENEKFASAIIQPNFVYLHDWCSQHKCHFHTNSDLIKLPSVIKKYQQEILKLNKKLGDYEQIKRFRLIPDEWSSITGELSPTLKLKRKYILEKYKEIVDEIYL